VENRPTFQNRICNLLYQPSGTEHTCLVSVAASSRRTSDWTCSTQELNEKLIDKFQSENL
jgi:hypothetical protein